MFLAGALTVIAVSTMGTQANLVWAAALKPGIPTNTTPVTIGEPTAFSGAFLPYLSSSASTNFVVEQQFGSLLHLCQNPSVVPELVAKWWYESNGQRLYMQLSKNAVWSDGTPITSADVGLAVNFLASSVYNNQLLGTQVYRVLPIAGSRAVMAGQAQTVAGFHAVNGSEFYFQLRAPDPSALVRDFAGMMPLPSAVLGSIPYASWPTSQFAADPDVGNGPFLISSSGGAQVDLTANRKFVLGIPKLQKFIVRVATSAVLPGLLLIYDLQSNPPAIQGYVMGWQFGVDPNPADLWSANAMYNIDTVNWINTADAAVAANNSLIAEQESAAATNTATRQQILNQWQALVSQNAPENFLVDPNLLGVQSTRLQGVVWSGAQEPIDSWKWTVS